MRALSCYVLTALSLVSSASVGAAKRTVPPEVQAAYDDIQQTLGGVPTFYKEFPEAFVAPAWAEMKGLQLSATTALTGKDKELIGLAVASQVPCKYCVYAHTQFAKLNGASDAELDEAVLGAAYTRKWSTYLNGQQQSLADFKKEIDAALKGGGAKAPIEVTDAASAMKDIEQTVGLSFLKKVPPSGLPGAWAQFKAYELGTTTVSSKTKELISLAVASQIPCAYCVSAHTSFARAAGATDQEINEAIGMAALTRQWSTWLNGSMQDEATFKKDVDQIVAHVKKAMKMAAR